jgi:hypothetical protein
LIEVLVMLINIFSSRAFTQTEHPAKRIRVGMSPKDVRKILGKPKNIIGGRPAFYSYEGLRIEFEHSRVVDLLLV